MAYIHDEPRIVKKLKCMRRINSIVEELESKQPTFPFNHCVSSSLLLHLREGFLIVEGKYCGAIDDAYRKKAKEADQKFEEDTRVIPHNFSYDPDTGLFYDITSNQFSSTNPKVEFFSPKSPSVEFDLYKVGPKTTHFVQNIFAYDGSKKIYHDVKKIFTS